MGAVTLPAAWRIAWTKPGEAGGGAIAIALQALGGGHESTSMAFWRGGGEPFGARFPLGAARLALPETPTLDEAWTLFLFAWREAGRELPPAFEAMCRYAEDVRQGHLPERVPPERTVAAVYLALVQAHLARAEPARERFLGEAMELARLVAARLEAGARLNDDDLFLDAPAFERHLAALAQDRKLFSEDLARARRFDATLPAARSGSGGARKLPLLALARPVATQFKLWVRREGYPLLLVETAPGQLVVSADPAAKAQVGWLAEPLGAAERAAGGHGLWYDGARHGGTLAASPLEGSKLDLDGAVRALRGPLSLARLAAPGHARKVMAAAGVAAGLAVAAAGLAVLLSHRAPGAPGAPAGARSGEPVKRQMISLVAAEAKGMTHYAVISGVCRYPPGHELRSTCNDARAVRDLLEAKYGYRPENVLFLVDDPEPGEAVFAAPTTERLRKAVEVMSGRIQQGDPRHATFLFYYAGHGGAELHGSEEFGVLQPAGYFDHADEAQLARGWEMKTLRREVAELVPANHVMIVLDCCFSGFAGARGADRLTPDVMSLWKEKAKVVLTAGTADQKSWEDPAWGDHGALTGFLLAGLGEHGKAAADLNGDGVVTDDELARYVEERVPPAVMEKKGRPQTPQYFRLDGAQTERGQFLFVPPALAN